MPVADVGSLMLWMMLVMGIGLFFQLACTHADASSYDAWRVHRVC